jgi:hypothetical protein
MKKSYSAVEYLAMLDAVVGDFLAFFEGGKDYSRVIYTDWTAKDVLGHVLMWHESFARNVEDIVGDRKPNPLKGSLAEVNERGVSEMKSYTIEELQSRMREAQKSIRKNIFSEKVGLIPYKKGSRDYTGEEHLEVVQRHIKGHLADLESAYSEKEGK